MAPEPGRAHLASPVQVRVIGKEFHWEFQYPGPDGKLDTPDDVTAERILRLPPDQKVEFEVTSSDYVYILGIPVNENGSRSVDTEKAKTGTGQADKIREIAVPGMVHRIEHQFHRTGRLDLMVDPLCGFQALHDPRMGQILISPDYDFRSLFPCQQQPDR